MVGQHNKGGRKMKRDLKSKSGTVAVWLAVAVIAIVLMSMLATHMAGWSAWALLGAAGIVAVLIFLGVITAQTHFAVLFGVIGAATVVLAAIIKLVR